ncbi:MAG: hypothetical protein M3Y59_00705 [Myxococcota bacterium]|nr:hypothetical protein [Myxococcota bacterium]
MNPMNYELVLHPDVSRRLQTLTRAPRESVTAALGDLARECNEASEPETQLVGTWVTGSAGARFRVQLSFDHEARAMRVLSLRPDTNAL